MQEILLTLSVEQANRILEILSQAPYRNVADLINLISNAPLITKEQSDPPASIEE